jgi:hypothetical protein
MPSAEVIGKPRGRDVLAEGQTGIIGKCRLVAYPKVIGRRVESRRHVRIVSQFVVGSTSVLTL